MAKAIRNFSFYKDCANATISGMVKIDKIVVKVTTLTERLVSVSNFVANIEVAAAVGALAPIVRATSIGPLIPINHKANKATRGRTISLRRATPYTLLSLKVLTISL